MEKERIDYGIKYAKVKLSEIKYILIPIDVVEGYSMGNLFYSSDVYKVADSITTIEEQEFLIDSIYNAKELCEIYDYDDIEFVKEYFFTEEKDSLILVESTPKGITKKRVNMKIITAPNPREEYSMQKKKPAVILNEDCLDALLSISDIEILKKELLRYRNLISQFKSSEAAKGTTKIVVENGHVKEIETLKEVQKAPAVVESNKKSIDIDPTGVSLKGLETYIKERVFGHDEEIKIIAKTLIMNYRGGLKYGTEPILIIGETGTGKTETIKAAANYLGLPFIEVNTANLVPEGIKGPSIEDCLYSLIVACNYDLDKAERALIFFDEFDKIGESGLDIKEAVKEIMLKFLEGTTFLIDKDKSSEDFNFRTHLLNKVYAGAFQNLFDSKKPVGFKTFTEETTFDPHRIYDSQYFGKELVTRIPHIIPFYPLDRETQKRVILESKISLLRAKKIRYEEEFKVKLIATDSYINSLLDLLSSKDKSMRDLNNLILKSLDFVECALLENEGLVREAILSSETVTNPHKFTLK